MAVGKLMTAYPSLRIAMLSVHSSPVGPLGTLNTGGMSVYVRELARWLGAAGHRVDIFTYVSGQQREVTLYPGVRLIYLNGNSGSDIAKEQLPDHLQRVFDALEHYRRSQDLRYDLVHSHYWLSGVVGAMAKTHWECPHLTMFHTLGVLKNKTDSEENEPDHRIAHERKLVHSADGVVVPARKELDNLLLDYYASSEKIAVIPCGVNLEQFRPIDRTAARAAIGLASDDPIALYVGRFAPLKGLDLLLSAVARLKKHLPNLKLLVAGGDGPTATGTLDLIEQSRQLGIQQQVSFVGRVDHDDLPNYYNAADLLVVPSHYESFGLVVLEALACGTPVAATRFGAAETVLQPNRNGVIIPNPDAAAVADAMHRQLTRSHQDRLSRSEIRETVAGYDWRRIAASVAELYHQLVDNRSKLVDTQPPTRVCGVSK
jgi:D-inositol-3-phosphate glycosyltransferase